MVDVEDILLIYRSVSGNIDLKPGKEKFFFLLIQLNRAKSNRTLYILGNIHNVCFISFSSL